ncbi:MAG: rod shape-determining protein RodA [Nitrospirae bacterium]|nr:rod shape-determining protein RodA [Nitrospirota bacterium]MBI3594765.1 rod shape-determining protein RodA [Nitrospirota bacterium]
MFDRRLITKFDWKFLLIVFGILFLSVLSLYSVSLHKEQVKSALYLKQIYWIIIAFGAFFIAMVIDYHTISRFAYLIYGVMVLLLLLVMLFGRVGLGAQRWLSLGPFSFQPSEFAKLGILLVLAKYFSENAQGSGFRMSQLAFPLVLLGIPFMLVLKQPDLGTGLSLSFIFISMLFLVGFRSKSLIFVGLIFLMFLPFLWNFFWHHLKSYQKERLLTFLNPTNDPSGTGYHIIQSKIAIGSGGLFGKGLLGGTQSQLKFLPEGHTDFIFAVFAEEWGFIGILILLVLFGLLLLWGVDVAFKAKDALGTFLAVGVIGMIGFNVMINISMTLGMMPVVGVPLPLMSYGGTAMVTTMAALGILMNVKIRRFMLFY